MSQDARRIERNGPFEAGFDAHAAMESALADPLLIVPSHDGAPIQETHITHGWLSRSKLGQWLGLP